MQLSIVIPSFNERNNVKAIVDRIEGALQGIQLAYEIWFIDDSSDDTPRILAELASQNPHVNFHHRSAKSGLGTAVVEGFRRSKGEYIVVMDADLQHPPELIPEMVNQLREVSDVVIPSRFIAGGSDGGLNAFRKLVSWTARSIGRLAIKRLRKVTDCTGGFFGLRRQVVERADLNPVGWKILIEVLVKGSYQSVVEIPYAFLARNADESKMSLAEQWNYLRHILKLLWSSAEDRRFVLYCLVGGLGVLVNLAAMSVLFYGFRIHAVAASVLASVIAMIHNFLWHDRVTWKEHRQAGWRKTLRMPVFVLISLSGIAVTALFVRLFEVLGLWELAGQCVGIVAATGWTFLANNRWTWPRSLQEMPDSACETGSSQVLYHTVQTTRERES